MTPARHSDFADSHRGKVLKRLLIASLVVSTISFIFDMIRLGIGSYFMIASGWLVTIIHHSIVFHRLAKYKKQTTTPTCDTPPFLKHAGNIWTLALFGLHWLTGSILSLTLAAFYSIEGYAIFAYALTGIMSGVFGAIESGILVGIIVLCWKALSQEGYGGVASRRVHDGNHSETGPVHLRSVRGPSVDDEVVDHDASSIMKVPV